MTVDNYDKEVALQEEEENDPNLKDYMKRANPPVYRRQYLCLEQLAGKKFSLDNNILCFNHEGMTVEDASMRPMCVVLRNLFREADPDMENEVYDAYRHTLRQFYSYEPRIHIGNNLRVLKEPL